MKLTFCGAARTVTGSKHLIELNSGTRFLLDCGLFQGRRSEAYEKNRRFPFNPSDIDFVILSHAHIDHSGLLPKLYKDGFRGRVYCTHATYSLCSLMLMDSAHIQEKDTGYVNKIQKRKGDDRILPLYESKDAEDVLQHFVGIPYETPFSPADDVTFEFRDAGHILGAASVNLTIKENGKTTRIGFTGDIGNPGRPILKDPVKMADCDYLITESTYGGRVHEPADQAKKNLAEVVSRTSARGGKVIIPSFAVGRTQEIVYALDQLWNEGELPPIPSYVDSPLAVRATGVYLSHPECYDAELLEYMITDENPFGFERLSYVRDVEKSKELNTMRVPMIIISASGMCEAGRILHHLKNNVEDNRNTVVMVGYCADHTLGKRLIEKDPHVKIFGEQYDLKAEVVVMNNYSAHADEPGMIDFIGKLDKSRLKKIFLVHGAYERQQLFETALGQEGYQNIVIPEFAESFEL